MREHGLSDYSQIPKNEKTRMFKEMRTELDKPSDSRYKGSGTSPKVKAGTNTIDYVKLSEDLGKKLEAEYELGIIFQIDIDTIRPQLKTEPNTAIFLVWKN